MMDYMSDWQRCSECGSHHAVRTGRCVHGIKKDAAVVIDACGAAYSWQLLDRLISDMQAKLPPREWGEMRIVSAVPLAQIYQGLCWVKDGLMPDGVIVCESGGAHGVLVNFTQPKQPE